MNIREELIGLGIPIPAELPLDRWAAALTDAPCKNTVKLIGLTTVLFYLAERNHNPKVRDIWDAMVYCSTCISVGYADIFPRTPLGKIIGSALMTIGPSLAARLSDGPVAAPSADAQQEMLQTLRQILDRLPPATQASAG